MGRFQVKNSPVPVICAALNCEKEIQTCRWVTLDGKGAVAPRNFLDPLSTSTAGSKNDPWRGETVAVAKKALVCRSCDDELRRWRLRSGRAEVKDYTARGADQAVSSCRNARGAAQRRARGSPCLLGRRTRRPLTAATPYRPNRCVPRR